MRPILTAVRRSAPREASITDYRRRDSTRVVKISVQATLRSPVATIVATSIRIPISLTHSVICCDANTDSPITSQPAFLQRRSGWQWDDWPCSVRQIIESFAGIDAGTLVRFSLLADGRPDRNRPGAITLILFIRAAIVHETNPDSIRRGHRSDL